MPCSLPPQGSSRHPTAQSYRLITTRGIQLNIVACFLLVMAQKMSMQLHIIVPRTNMAQERLHIYL